MGAGLEVRQTGDQTGSGLTVQEWAAAIAARRATISTGQLITQADIGSILAGLNLMLNHYHTYSDRTTGDSYLTRNTGVAGNQVSTIAALASLDKQIIYSYDHNVMVIAAKSLSFHRHSAEDSSA